MYKRHFKLNADPFSLTPDPAFLFESRDHAEALAGLRLGLRERRGLIVMVGEVGTGKTTLLYSLLYKLGPKIHTAYVANTRLPFEDILRSALKDFGLTCESRRKGNLLDTLNKFLLRCAEDGATAALVIDEAQNLEEETFEDLRLLLNFETFKSKLLQIILVGQPELDVKLRSATLRQVAERVAVRVYLNPLSRKQSRRYIRHRLGAARGSAATFTRPALALAARRSRGIPRRMNIACHNALLFAYGRKLSRVNRAAMAAALRASEGACVAGPKKSEPEGKLRSFTPRRRLGTSWAAGGLAAGTAGAAIMFAGPGTLARWATLIVAPAATTIKTSSQPAPHDGARQAVTGIMAAVSSQTPSLEKPQKLQSATRPVPRPRAIAPRPVRALSGSAGSAPSEMSTITASRAPHAENQKHRDEARLRMVRVQPGETLYSLTRAVYGRYTPELLALVQAANPQITDADRILAGDELHFPASDLANWRSAGGKDE